VAWLEAGEHGMDSRAIKFRQTFGKFCSHVGLPAFQCAHQDCGRHPDQCGLGLIVGEACGNPAPCIGMDRKILERTEAILQPAQRLDGRSVRLGRVQFGEELKAIAQLFAILAQVVQRRIWRVRVDFSPNFQDLLVAILQEFGSHIAHWLAGPVRQ